MSHNIGEKGTVMIEIQNLTKVFQEQTVLQNINATFDAGLIHGVIGKNGAGKTVLLRLLCGLMHPSKGQVIVDGKQLGKDVDFAPDAGIIIETPCFLPYLSGFQNLKELASIRNIISKEEIAEAMEQVKLDPASRKHVGKYSLGMRQRLGIAQAIMERPRYLILDEPMNGLDTQGMEDVRELLQKQKETEEACQRMAEEAEQERKQKWDAFEKKCGAYMRQHQELATLLQSLEAYTGGNT